MKIKDVMVQDVVAINPSASLAEAAELMRQANVGILPVVEDGQVCGVITDRDLVVRAIAIGADLTSTPVGECATGDPILAHPDWNLDQAMHAMARAQIGRLKWGSRCHASQSARVRQVPTITRRLGWFSTRRSCPATQPGRSFAAPMRARMTVSHFCSAPSRRRISVTTVTMAHPFFTVR